MHCSLIYFIAHFVINLSWFVHLKFFKRLHQITCKRNNSFSDNNYYIIYMQNNNYDLSIIDFKQYLKGILKFTGTSIQFLFLVLKNNKILIFLVLLLSAALSFFLLNRNKDVVEVRMGCIYSDNSQKVYGELLQQIDFLIENSDYDKAAHLLQMDKNELKQVLSLEGKTLTLGKMEEVYSANKDPFYIYAKVTNEAILPKLEQKVLAYLNQNPLSQKSVERQRQKWEGRISFYEQQLFKLDSLKDVIRQSYISGNNNIDLAQQNNSVVDIYKLSDSLSFFLGDIKYYYNNYASVEKIYGFMPVKKSTQKTIIKKTIVISALAVILVWILLALKQIAQKTENQLP